MSAANQFAVTSAMSQPELETLLLSFERDLGVREEIARSLLARRDRFPTFMVTVSHEAPPADGPFCYYKVAGRTVHIVGNGVFVEIPPKFA